MGSSHDRHVRTHSPPRMDQRLEASVPGRLHPREERRRRLRVDAQPADEPGEARGPLDARAHARLAARGAERQAPPRGSRARDPPPAPGPSRREAGACRHTGQNASSSRRPGATGAQRLPPGDRPRTSRGRAPPRAPARMQPPTVADGSVPARTAGVALHARGRQRRCGVDRRRPEPEPPERLEAEAEDLATDRPAGPGSRATVPFSSWRARRRRAERKARDSHAVGPRAGRSRPRRGLPRGPRGSRCGSSEGHHLRVRSARGAPARSPPSRRERAVPRGPRPPRARSAEDGPPRGSASAARGRGVPATGHLVTRTRVARAGLGRRPSRLRPPRPPAARNGRATGRTRRAAGRAPRAGTPPSRPSSGP